MFGDAGNTIKLICCTGEKQDLIINFVGLFIFYMPVISVAKSKFAVQGKMFPYLPDDSLICVAVFFNPDPFQFFLRSLETKMERGRNSGKWDVVIQYSQIALSKGDVFSYVQL